MNNTLKIDSGKTLMVAHRGVSGLEMENTHAAFVAAGNRTHFGIETDVHRTLDGHFVCIHDDTTGRVAIDNLKIEESTFDTLRALLLCDKDGAKGRTDLRIPTLAEYVRICKKYGKVGVLELKNRFDPGDIEKIIAVINEEDYLDGIIFISFSLENMIDLRAMLPRQACQYLTTEYSAELLETLCKYHMDVDMHYRALTEENVREMHEHGIRVNAWTCDKPEEALELVKWGVDYITSNILE